MAVLALIGIIIAYRNRKDCGIMGLYFLMWLGLGLSYILTKRLSFAFLIDYERSDYSNRMLITATFFLLPFIIFTIYKFLYRLRDQNTFIKSAFSVFAILLITVSLYASYPRLDSYHNSHGYAVSQNDVDAVRWIEETAENNYIVLANQQVSAAALREFGFKKYYTSKSAISSPQSQIFYYPIPTGGQLYQYYLDMVYEKPTRATMLSAMDLTGVNEAYFVLNKYWWASPKIVNEAKLEAGSWQEIDNGEIYIFKYIY